MRSIYNVDSSFKFIHFAPEGHWHAMLVCVCWDHSKAFCLCTRHSSSLCLEKYFPCHLTRDYTHIGHLRSISKHWFPNSKRKYEQAIMVVAVRDVMFFSCAFHDIFHASKHTPWWLIIELGWWLDNCSLWTGKWARRVRPLLEIDNAKLGPFRVG